MKLEKTKKTYLALVWPEPKMFDCLSVAFGAPDQYRVCARRCPERQLINGETLASGQLNSFSSRSRESQGRDGEFWHGEQTNIVRDGGHSDNDLVFTSRFG
jgi:hypothetical protein